MVHWAEIEADLTFMLN